MDKKNPMNTDITNEINSKSLIPQSQTFNNSCLIKSSFQFSPCKQTTTHSLSIVKNNKSTDTVLTNPLHKNSFDRHREVKFSNRVLVNNTDSEMLVVNRRDTKSKTSKFFGMNNKSSYKQSNSSWLNNSSVKSYNSSNNLNKDYMDISNNNSTNNVRSNYNSNVNSNYTNSYINNNMAKQSSKHSRFLSSKSNKLLSPIEEDLKSLSKQSFNEINDYNSDNNKYHYYKRNNTYSNNFYNANDLDILTKTKSFLSSNRSFTSNSSFKYNLEKVKFHFECISDAFLNRRLTLNTFDNINNCLNCRNTDNKNPKAISGRTYSNTINNFTFKNESSSNNSKVFVINKPEQTISFTIKTMNNDFNDSENKELNRNSYINNTNSNNTNNNSNSNLLTTKFALVKKRSKSNKNISKNLTSNLSQEAETQISDLLLHLAKIVHEFKNPLQTVSILSNNVSNDFESITGMTDIALDKIKNKEFKIQCEDMKRLYNDINYLKSIADYIMILVEDLNDFSKKQLKKVKSTSANTDLFIFNNFDLVKTLYFCINIFKFRKTYDSNKKNLMVEISLDPQLPRIICFNEVKLKQILINLLSNAYKFTFNGKISLNTFITKNRKIRFEIEDTGTGMSEAEINSLFTPYKRLEKNQQHNSHGSGLGLIVIKEFLEMLGSNLVVKSVEGKGSCFSFELDPSLIQERKDSDKNSLNNYKNVNSLNIQDNNNSNSNNNSKNDNNSKGLNLPSSQNLGVNLTPSIKNSSDTSSLNYQNHNSSSSVNIAVNNKISNKTSFTFKKNLKKIKTNYDSNDQHNKSNTNNKERPDLNQNPKISEVSNSLSSDARINIFNKESLFKSNNSPNPESSNASNRIEFRSDNSSNNNTSKSNTRSKLKHNTSHSPPIDFSQRLSLTPNTYKYVITNINKDEYDNNNHNENTHSKLEVLKLKNEKTMHIPFKKKSSKNDPNATYKSYKKKLSNTKSYKLSDTFFDFDLDEDDFPNKEMINPLNNNKIKLLALSKSGGSISKSDNEQTFVNKNGICKNIFGVSSNKHNNNNNKNKKTNNSNNSNYSIENDTAVFKMIKEESNNNTLALSQKNNKNYNADAIDENNKLITFNDMMIKVNKEQSNNAINNLYHCNSNRVKENDYYNEKKGVLGKNLQLLNNLNILTKQNSSHNVLKANSKLKFLKLEDEIKRDNESEDDNYNSNYASNKSSSSNTMVRIPNLNLQEINSIIQNEKYQNMIKNKNKRKSSKSFKSKVKSTISENNSCTSHNCFYIDNEFCHKNTFGNKDKDNKHSNIIDNVNEKKEEERFATELSAQEFSNKIKSRNKSKINEKDSILNLGRTLDYNTNTSEDRTDTLNTNNISRKAKLKNHQSSKTIVRNYFSQKNFRINKEKKMIENEIDYSSNNQSKKGNENTLDIVDKVLIDSSDCEKSPVLNDIGKENLISKFKDFRLFNFKNTDIKDNINPNIDYLSNDKIKIKSKDNSIKEDNRALKLLPDHKQISNTEGNVNDIAKNSKKKNNYNININPVDLIEYNNKTEHNDNKINANSTNTLTTFNPDNIKNFSNVNRKDSQKQNKLDISPFCQTKSEMTFKSSFNILSSCNNSENNTNNILLNNYTTKSLQNKKTGSLYENEIIADKKQHYLTENIYSRNTKKSVTINNCLKYITNLNSSECQESDEMDKSNKNNENNNSPLSPDHKTNSIRKNKKINSILRKKKIGDETVLKKKMNNVIVKTNYYTVNLINPKKSSKRLLNEYTIKANLTNIRNSNDMHNKFERETELNENSDDDLNDLTYDLNQRNSSNKSNFINQFISPLNLERLVKSNLTNTTISKINTFKEQDVISKPFKFSNKEINNSNSRTSFDDKNDLREKSSYNNSLYCSPYLKNRSSNYAEIYENYNLNNSNSNSSKIHENKDNLNNPTTENCINNNYKNNVLSDKRSNRNYYKYSNTYCQNFIKILPETNNFNDSLYRLNSKEITPISNYTSNNKANDLDENNRRCNNYHSNLVITENINHSFNNSKISTPRIRIKNKSISNYVCRNFNDINEIDNNFNIENIDLNNTNTNNLNSSSIEKRLLNNTFTHDSFNNNNFFVKNLSPNSNNAMSRIALDHNDDKNDIFEFNKPTTSMFFDVYGINTPDNLLNNLKENNLSFNNSRNSQKNLTFNHQTSVNTDINSVNSVDTKKILHYNNIANNQFSITTDNDYSYGNYNVNNNYLPKPNSNKILIHKTNSSHTPEDQYTLDSLDKLDYHTKNTSSLNKLLKNNSNSTNKNYPKSTFNFSSKSNKTYSDNNSKKIISKNSSKSHSRLRKSLTSIDKENLNKNLIINSSIGIEEEELLNKHTINSNMLKKSSGNSVNTVNSLSILNNSSKQKLKNHNSNKYTRLSSQSSQTFFIVKEEDSKSDYEEDHSTNIEDESICADEMEEVIDLMNYYYTQNKTKEIQQDSKNIDLKIMLCDDETLILKSLKKLLEDICKDFKKEVFIQTCSNGLECLYKMYDDFTNKGLCYSMLLIDEQMPCLYGTEATKLLRKLQQEKCINNFLIYSVTAHIDEESINNIMSYGCDGTVVKPLNKRSLVSLLNSTGLMKGGKL